MSSELICPDCGGVIGGRSDGTRPRCHCGGGYSADEVAVEAIAPPELKKICVQCGKDVTGKKRAKDSRGYWCYECHRADMVREKAAQQPRVRCPDCGRPVLETSLVSFDGIPICVKCRDARVLLTKHKKKFRDKVGDKHYNYEDRKKLKIYLGIFIFLLLIILLRRTGILPNLF